MDWCRLWHDLPNDPKWRTIAKITKQPVSSVISVYIHLLVQASANATDRGRPQPTAEDLASALDLETDQVEAILEAMKGRVWDGERLTGWEKRQPKREDGSAERSRKRREEEKLRNNQQSGATAPTATDRNRPQPTAPDKIREEKNNTEQFGSREPVVHERGGSFYPPGSENGFGTADWFERLYTAHPKKKDRGISQTYAAESISAGADPAEIERVHGLYCVHVWGKDKPQFAPTLAQWLLDQGWKYPPNQNGNGKNGHHAKPELCRRCSKAPCECHKAAHAKMLEDLKRVRDEAKSRKVR